LGECRLGTGYDYTRIRKNTDRENGKTGDFKIDFAAGIVEYDTVLNTGIRRGDEYVVFVTTIRGKEARRISNL
jgi:hypothetical protein